ATQTLYLVRFLLLLFNSTRAHFPYTTLFRSREDSDEAGVGRLEGHRETGRVHSEGAGVDGDARVSEVRGGHSSSVLTRSLVGKGAYDLFAQLRPEADG